MYDAYSRQSRDKPFQACVRRIGLKSPHHPASVWWMQFAPTIMRMVLLLPTSALAHVVCNGRALGPG